MPTFTARRRSTPLHCPTCTAPAQPGWRWCGVCGARLNPTWWSMWGFRATAVVVVLAFLVGARVFFGTLWEGDLVEAAPPTDTTTTAAPPPTLAAVENAGSTTVVAPPPPPSGPVRPISFSASATAGPSQNSCGDRTVYDVAYLLDENPETGWRTKGDGTGERISFTFNGPTRLSQVGLIPGYAKVDPCNGNDRFRQLRRILEVRWTFDGGATVEQTFVEDPSLQTIPVDVVTTAATIEILDVTSGPEIDHTPISEVSFLGGPA